jgi:hypothetical protein
MKLTIALTLTGTVLSAIACRGLSAAPTSDDGPRTPVLLELFTSEGCSSCPPADALLASLVAEQPVAGAEIIALGEHVDYWNSLGWQDRFSSPAFTARQADYRSAVFPENAIYTPQAIVDGTLECIGSDGPALRRAIETAAHTPKATLRATSGAPSAGRIPVTIDLDIPTTVPREGDATVLVAVVEDGLLTEVTRGENRNRTLTHAAVVRVLDVVGHLDDQAHQFSTSTSVQVPEGVRAETLRLVAFVQERASHRVLGAAQVNR